MDGRVSREEIDALDRIREDLRWWSTQSKVWENRYGGSLPLLDSLSSKLKGMIES